MKNYLTILITILFFTACNTENPKDKQTEKSIDIDQHKKEIALKFINSYVANCNKENGALPASDLADSTKLTTTSFRTALKNSLDDAYLKDPVIGLGADPILDAQDYPEKGFELETFDKRTNTYTVKGIDWPDFKLNIKLSEENGKWLIDACGLVNAKKN